MDLTDDEYAVVRDILTGARQERAVQGGRTGMMGASVSPSPLQRPGKTWAQVAADERRVLDECVTKGILTQGRQGEQDYAVTRPAYDAYLVRRRAEASA